jgi:hypothetical protein
MVKEAKFFRKRAAKAELMALTVSDAEISERFLGMAKAYRGQADVLKSKKKGKSPAKGGADTGVPSTRGRGAKPTNPGRSEAMRRLVVELGLRRRID